MTLIRQSDIIPQALPCPDTLTTSISKRLVEDAIAVSRQSPRGRVILPFHKQGADALQRMLNALQPGSYIQPHRHSTPPKAESVVVLRGAICYITFSEMGDPNLVLIAGSASTSFGIDADAGVYHTFFALEPDTVLFEVKAGPYDSATDKEFAPWAPGEGAAGSKEFLRGLESLAERNGKGTEGSYPEHRLTNAD